MDWTAASSYLPPKLIGHSRALSLFLTGATVSPDSPLLAGLYHSVLPTREEVFPAALALARDLAENTSQTAVAVTKALVWRGPDNIEEMHVLDSRAIRVLGAAGDAAEGARAFKERRLPKMTDKLSDHLAPWMPWVSEEALRRRSSVSLKTPPYTVERNRREPSQGEAVNDSHVRASRYGALFGHHDACILFDWIWRCMITNVLVMGVRYTMILNDR